MGKPTVPRRRTQRKRKTPEERSVKVFRRKDHKRADGGGRWLVSVELTPNRLRALHTLVQSTARTPEVMRALFPHAGWGEADAAAKIISHAVERLHAEMGATARAIASVPPSPSTRDRHHRPVEVRVVLTQAEAKHIFAMVEGYLSQGIAQTAGGGVRKLREAMLEAAIESTPERQRERAALREWRRRERLAAQIEKERAAVIIQPKPATQKSPRRRAR